MEWQKWRKRVCRNPRDIEGRLELANYLMYLQAGRRKSTQFAQEAEQFVREALRLLPSDEEARREAPSAQRNAQAHYLLGYALQVQAKTAEASKELQAAAALNPALVPLIEYMMSVRWDQTSPEDEEGSGDDGDAPVPALLRPTPPVRPAGDAKPLPEDDDKEQTA